MNFDRLLTEALNEMDLINNVASILINNYRKDNKPVNPLKIKNAINNVLNPESDGANNDDATPYFTDNKIITQIVKILSSNKVKLVDIPLK